MIGYLQHGSGTAGPFRTENVIVRHEYADRYLVMYAGVWRRVVIQVGRTFIRYRGEKITVLIDGV
jgi:hypothetical protein